MKCQIPDGFYDLDNLAVSMLQGIKTKARQHIRKVQNNSKRESQQEKWERSEGSS
jgi:hypothetical protein